MAIHWVNGCVNSTWHNNIHINGGVISRGICTAVKGWQEWRRSWPRHRSNPLHTDKRIVITPTTTLIIKLLKAIKRSTHVSCKAFRMIYMIFLVSSCSALQKREAREVCYPSSVSVVQSTGKIPRITSCVFSEEFFQELSSLDSSKKNTPGDSFLSSKRSRLQQTL